MENQLPLTFLLSFCRDKIPGKGEDSYQKIIDKAHQLPYGDILVEFLELFRRTFLNHVHPYPGLPPCQTEDYIQTSTYDLDKILSDSVRIN